MKGSVASRSLAEPCYGSALRTLAPGALRPPASSRDVDCTAESSYRAFPFYSKSIGSSLERVTGALSFILYCFLLHLVL